MATPRRPLRDIKPALAVSQELQDSLDEDTTVLRKLVDRLDHLYDTNEARKRYEAAYKEDSEDFRQWLAAHPGEAIEDREKGYIAHLLPRSKGDTYDVAAMPVELVLKLAQAHALNVDRAVLDSLRGKSVLPVDADRYRIPGGETTAFYVERTKKD